MKTTLLTVLAAVGLLAGHGLAAGGNQNQNQGQAINTPPVVAALTPAEAAHIVHMCQEEKLARDVYLTLAEIYDHPAFANIALAEQRHMDAVGLLLTKYGLTNPVADDTVGVFSDDAFGVLYTEFTTLGAKSLLDALNVGVEIERTDINDLKLALKETDKGDIQWVFGRLLRGSMNHLGAFTRNVAAGGNACTPQNCPRLGDGTGNPNDPACQGQGWAQGQGWGRGRGGRGAGNGNGPACQGQGMGPGRGRGRGGMGPGNGNGWGNGSCIGAGAPQQNQDTIGQADRQQKRDGTGQAEPSV